MCALLQEGPSHQLNGQVCGLCGDEVGVTEDGDLFVACNECAFPICRACYEYERREGTQVCPQCKTRFKRLKGCARVAGDEDEDSDDDIMNEFGFTDSADARDRVNLSLLTDGRMVGQLFVIDDSALINPCIYFEPFDSYVNVATFSEYFYKC